MNSNTSYVTKGGLITALSIIFIYISTIIPTNRIFILAITSCLIPITVLISNIKFAFIVYLCTSLLSLMLVGLKSQVILYIIFFGLYGIVKYYIEILRKPLIEIILKFLFFNVSVILTFFVFKKLFINNLSIKIPIIYIIGIMEIVFLLYDYALTLFINYFNNHFRKILRKH
ncbi:hypothetical protein CLOACE_19150 [Clostridium acetireducens DSM 10703]|jgi:hypothetical protein|uniref:Uncharacterized protein n=1 Tax=Clostridium acetireducens DSM 10703 TaxID=1121290 RepID=A0A1E8EX55_9CLOT|nr:hypothetical protein [Clostridium acetireducens]OFI05096.1 hypothetical protein CLOACE_19150 [Clostridium acetireducens DSM 10703]